MTETKSINSTKHYDFEGRTLDFAKEVIQFIKTLPQTDANRELIKQLIRSAGSVGANYIEANEALSKKDFAMRVKICRKEAKESGYWLKLVETNKKESETKRDSLLDEANQLVKIFNAIVIKST